MHIENSAGMVPAANDNEANDALRRFMKALAQQLALEDHEAALASQRDAAPEGGTAS